MAETTNFNYVDSLMNSTNVQFMADQHDHAIQTTGRKSYIFLLIMSDIIAIRFKENGKIYFIKNDFFPVVDMDYVVCQTERGLEL